MTFNEPKEFKGDFPSPAAKERRLPVKWLALVVALIALIALLALSY